MAITKSTLGLSVREKDNRSTGDLPLTTAQAKKWLADLPMANITETANLYFAAAGSGRTSRKKTAYS